VKVATKALELRGKQERVGVVDLLGRMATAAFGSPDAAMRLLDLIESFSSFGPPV
jgi:hypothetical protein